MQSNVSFASIDAPLFPLLLNMGDRFSKERGWAVFTFMF